MNDKHTAYVNGDRIRLLELEISERDLSRLTSVGQSAIRRLLRSNETHTSTTIAQLHSLTRGVGLTLAGVLAPADHVPCTENRDDEMARRLITVLLQDKRLIPWAHLAEAFGWTIQALHDAAEMANQSLRGSGLRVHITNSGLTLRANEGNVSSVIDTVERLRARDKSMDNATARVLYQVVTGSIAQTRIRKGHGPRLARLKNKGMVLVGRRGHDFIVPAEDVTFAFDV